MSLLKKAQAAAASLKAIQRTPDEFELAIAYCHGVVTLRQVDEARGNGGTSRQNGHIWVGATLIWAVRQGLLVESGVRPRK